MSRWTNILVSILGLFLILGAGCAKRVQICQAPEDNPQHHYLRGMDLIERSEFKDAYDRFDRGVSCDKEYGPGHGGLALATALMVVEEKGLDYKNRDVYKAYQRLDSAWKYAGDEEQEFAYHLASMRVYTALKPEAWLKTVVRDHKKAFKLDLDEPVLYYEGVEAAHYFMGAAYFEAREFLRARDSLSLVLGMKGEGKWNEGAEKLWKQTDKLVRAIAGRTIGNVGKEISVMETVSRADMAALLVDELKIDRLFAGRIPVISELPVLKQSRIPVDVADSPLRDEILTMIKWNIRGLEPVYDNAEAAYVFNPGAPVARKEFALALEDIIIRLTGDETIAAAFFGHQRSPYPDVPPASPWYNAVMNVTTRSIMETELSGEFRPDDPVDGAEAILAIRALRQKMNIY